MFFSEEKRPDWLRFRETTERHSAISGIEKRGPPCRDVVSATKWVPALNRTEYECGSALIIIARKRKAFGTSKSKQLKRFTMQRQPNTDTSGQPFSPEVVEAVWQKARTMGVHETLRVDAWGWTIVRSDYGNNRSRYGWEIDHIIPVSQGGGDELTNLQPLQWENNRRKDEMEGVIGSNRAEVHVRPPRATKHPRRK
jgi:hypothetical protein